MKKGFTLMELLVTIIVLGLILALTMPTVNKLINTSKDNVYLETVKNIEEAAHMYVINNFKDFSETVGVYNYVSIGQLQDSGLLVNTLIDPRTDIQINNGDVLVVMQSSGEYSYTFKNGNYVEDGLKLSLDSYRHGLTNTIWQDLSGNGYNGTLTGFTFGGSDGWVNDSLFFSNGSQGVSISNPLITQTTTNQSYTVSITYEHSAYTASMGLFGIGRLYLAYNNQPTLYAAYTNPDSYFVTTIAPLPLNQKQQVTYRFYRNSTTGEMRGRVYYNGEDYTYLSLPDDGNDLASAMLSNISTTNMTGAKIYSIKVYNRVLTDDEIEQNYIVDKERFNF